MYITQRRANERYKDLEYILKMYIHKFGAQTFMVDGKVYTVFDDETIEEEDV